jgi:hypothetical protein
MQFDIHCFRCRYYVSFEKQEECKNARTPLQVRQSMGQATINAIL